MNAFLQPDNIGSNVRLGHWLTRCLRLVGVFLLVGAFASDIVDIGVITQTEGIEIHRCHDGDMVLIEVIHVSTKTNHAIGWFETTTPPLYLSDLSMIPNGTNIFRVRIVCAGSTSEVSEVQFVIRRPIPKPDFSKAERFPQMPPMLPGMIMSLPGGTSVTNVPLAEAQLQGTNALKFTPRRRSQ